MHKKKKHVRRGRGGGEATQSNRRRPAQEALDALKGLPAIPKGRGGILVLKANSRVKHVSKQQASMAWDGSQKMKGYLRAGTSAKARAPLVRRLI